MQQRGEPYPFVPLILLRYFPHTGESLGHDFPALCQAPARLADVLLDRPASLQSLRLAFRRFVQDLLRYYRVLPLPSSVHGRLTPWGFPPRPVASPPPSAAGTSWFPCLEFPYLHRFFDSAESHDLAVTTVVLSLSHNRTASALWTRFISELHSLARRRPCLRFHCGPRDPQRKTRGQGGSLFLSCVTLSFTTPAGFTSAPDWKSASRCNPAPRRPGIPSLFYFALP